MPGHNEVCQVRVFPGLPKLRLVSVTDFLQYRELEQDLVPEWRAKYLDYKV